MPYDAAKAEAIVRFFEEYLVYIDGPLAGQPIRLRDWQADPLREIFGTVRDDGFREVNTVFWMMNKKQGKTEILAAGIGLFMLTIAGEMGATVFCAANSRDQATQVFKPCAEMIRQSPKLQSLGFDPVADIFESRKQIVYRPLRSTLTAVAAEAGTLHGKKPSCLIVDEIHAMRNRLMIDALREGMGTWEEPLTLYITNMGEVGGSPVFWEEKALADKVKRRPKSFPHYRQYQWEADPKMTDEQLLEEGPHWYELNPGLGDFMAIEDMRRACMEAKEKPSARPSVLRFRLGRASQPAEVWIPIEKWRKCKTEIHDEHLIGTNCYAGLDLSSHVDFSALALVFPEPGGGTTLLTWAFVPAGNVEEIERVTERPIRRWIEQGLVLETPGDIIDLDFIEDHIRMLKSIFRIRQLAYDNTFAEQITQHVEKMGIERVEFPQTFAHFNEPCRAFEREVYAGRMHHNGDPVLTYNVESTAVKSDDQERMRPIKIRERKVDSRRIDLVVASVMAYSLRMASKPKKVPTVSYV